MTCKVIYVWSNQGTAWGAEEIIRERCSVCGAEEICDEFNYCPMCGEKIDGIEHDESMVLPWTCGRI